MFLIDTLLNAEPSGMRLPGTPDDDPLFLTHGDHLWAKFMAYERLITWLEEELKRLRDGVAAEPQLQDLPAPAA